MRGGFADVNAEGLTILAEQAIPLAEVDPAMLAQEVKNAEEDVADAKDAAARDAAELRAAPAQGSADVAGAASSIAQSQRRTRDLKLAVVVAELRFEVGHPRGRSTWVWMIHTQADDARAAATAHRPGARVPATSRASPRYIGFRVKR